MNRKQLAIKNSIVSLFCQLLTVVLSFVTRSVFIKYLGVEMLGISSTFTSLLSTLSLADLGFQSAIVFLLYQPLYEKDYNRVNSIIYVLKRIYTVIGCLIIFLGLTCVPFLQNILKGITVTNYVKVLFLVQVASTAVTYFMAYRKTLLFADQRAYVTNAITTITNICFMVLKIVLVVLTSNYLFYVLSTLFQNIVDNGLTDFYDRKCHPYIGKVAFDKGIFREAWKNVKNVFIGRIAGYIYNSTDSLVISMFIGTVDVGFMVNYTTISSALKTIAQSILTPISPLIGNLLVDRNDVEKNEQILRIYTYIRYLIAGIFIIPMVVLMQDFITKWIGNDYLLSLTVVELLGVDLYIHFVHSALCDYIQGQGLFEEDKTIEIIGACSNIIFSICFVYNFGIIGVLIGTVISQSIFWIGRSIIVYKKCFPAVTGSLRKYWIKQVAYIIAFVLITVLIQKIYSHINISVFILRFLISGMICEIVFYVMIMLIFGRSYEHQETVALIKVAIKSVFSKLRIPVK